MLKHSFCSVKPPSSGKGLPPHDYRSAVGNLADGRPDSSIYSAKSPLTEPVDDADKQCMSTLRMDVLARLLDVADLRHRVIAQNVANVNTPGYHRLQVN